MDGIKVDFNEEYNHVVGLAADKYGYDEELQGVLKKVLPAMLESHSYEDKQLFYKMLSHTPIVVVNENDKINKSDLDKKYLGDQNSHMIDINEHESVYDTLTGDGAFISDIIFDKNANPIGKKQYLYIKKVAPENEKYGYLKERTELFGTGINVSHLIHELGHAWCSEMNSYEYENGILKDRCGTATITMRIEPNGDGTFNRIKESTEGLYIEEAMNTEMEVEALSRYLNMGKQATNLLFKSGPLIPSNYQGAISSVAEHILETPLGKDFTSYRLTGDKKYLDRINENIAKTTAYQRRMDATEESRAKDQVFLEPASEGIAEFLANCRDVYYPDKENMTPFQMLDNALNQSFDLGIHKMRFDVFNEKSFGQYKTLSLAALTDAYVPINQARDMLLGNDSKEQEEQK